MRGVGEMICTRCEGTGFIENGGECDTAVCDCCGDGEGWYGIPGEHYNSDDPPGEDGLYRYNGGLCECH